MIKRDGHIRVLPLHVANKIAAGEVVERPASVVKELVENAIDAGATAIRISITQGGRKLVAVQDDGCGMTRDDAVLSLERQATSKILDVNDIEEIDTLGFRGEAIPSIASVSRFTITTRRHESDEGTLVQVNAGQLAEVRAAGCPPGTLVEVRDLFCNVPARRKFLRAYATEESHVKQIFTVHALAHPNIGFSLNVDGRELYRLAPAANLADRVLDLFGKDFVTELLRIPGTPAPTAPHASIHVSGLIEKPNLNQPTRREQYIFVNGRPATAPSIAYALREAYPRRQGDVRPAVILFLDLPPSQVDVNVHPTKREVRFRDNTAVKQAIMSAIEGAFSSVGREALDARASLESLHDPLRSGETVTETPIPTSPVGRGVLDAPVPEAPAPAPPVGRVTPDTPPSSRSHPCSHLLRKPAFGPGDNASTARTPIPSPPTPAPIQVEFAVAPDSTESRPWQWFKYLAQTSSGYLLIETDSGLVTINPRAARERIAYEALLRPTGAPNDPDHPALSQALLLPETVQLSPADAARITASLPALVELGFSIEEFGRDTFKIDAVPQLLGETAPAGILTTIAKDLAEAGTRRGGARWREELIAKAVARSFAGATVTLTEDGAIKLVEELCVCRMPYICPRGKITMTLTSTRELNRKFSRD